MLATLADQRGLSGPRGTWFFERKLDGFRSLAFRNGARTRLLSRNRNDLGIKFPEVVEALNAQPVRDFVIDGEIVAMQGRHISFQFLQQRLKPVSIGPADRNGIRLAYYVFDLLYVNGHDVRSLPLRDRKRLLKKAISFDGPVRYTPHRTGSARAAFEAACSKGWEGIIAKRSEDRYISGRTASWLKLKCETRQEFIIGGYTDPQRSRIAFGALLIGYFDRGALKFAGKVGTGFDTQTLTMLGQRLKSLSAEERPFVPDPALPRRGVHWVKPKLIAEVEFSQWTRDDKLRHPRYLGLRPDKKPSQVVRERPAAIRSS